MNYKSAFILVSVFRW